MSWFEIAPIIIFGPGTLATLVFLAAVAKELLADGRRALAEPIDLDEYRARRATRANTIALGDER